MAIDLSRCSGCGACAVARKQTNATPPGVWWNRVHQYETGIYPHAKLKLLPSACQHCEEPACLDACPTKATRQRPDGIVTVDEEVCVGCGYCTWACPYGARSLNTRNASPYYPGKGLTPFEQYHEGSHSKGLIEKCTMCMDRVDAGQRPACVDTCSAGARVFGDLDYPESEVARLILNRGGRQRMESFGTRPKVYYLGLAVHGRANASGGA